MAKCWDKVQPKTKDTTQSLNITYHDDDDPFALLGMSSRWIKPRVQSKYTVILVITMLFILVLLAFLAGRENTIIYYAYQAVFLLVIIILEIMFVLGMNKTVECTYFDFLEISTFLISVDCAGHQRGDQFVQIPVQNV